MCPSRIEKNGGYDTIRSYVTCKKLCILSHIKVARQKWVGYVQRMNGDEMAKKIMDNTPMGRRKLGRLRSK